MANSPWKGFVPTPENPGNSKLMAWVRDHLTYEHDYCLIWPFARTTDGYGGLGFGKKAWRAHRYICTLVHGEPPAPEYLAAHSCGRGADGCVNPKHLSWKTPGENTGEGQTALDNRPQRKLTPQEAEEIRALKGLVVANQIAGRYGVLEAAIRDIWAGRTWREGRRCKVFTPAEVLEIRAQGESKTRKQLAEEYGARPDQIQKIVSRTTYAWVEDAIIPNTRATPACRLTTAKRLEGE